MDELIENTSGFYKLDGELFHAPNFVRAPDYELQKSLKDTYVYPVHGWTWFNSEEEAKAALGVAE